MRGSYLARFMRALAMSPSQKKYIRNLKICGITFFAFFALLYFLPNNLFSPGQIMIASAVVIATIKIIANSGRGARSAGAENLTVREKIEKYPILKVWYLICFIAALFFCIYIFRSGTNLIKEFGIGKGAITIFLLILPLVIPKLIIGEYEKFRKL